MNETNCYVNGVYGDVNGVYGDVNGIQDDVSGSPWLCANGVHWHVNGHIIDNDVICMTLLYVICSQRCTCA